MQETSCTKALTFSISLKDSKPTGQVQSVNRIFRCCVESIELLQLSTISKAIYCFRVVWREHIECYNHCYSFSRCLISLIWCIILTELTENDAVLLPWVPLVAVDQVNHSVDANITSSLSSYTLEHAG